MHREKKAVATDALLPASTQEERRDRASSSVSREEPEKEEREAHRDSAADSDESEASACAITTWIYMRRRPCVHGYTCTRRTHNKMRGRSFHRATDAHVGH